MSRVEIPVYSINRVGYAPENSVSGDPTNGMYFGDNEGETFLEIENPGTLAITVGAVVFHNLVDGITIPDKEITVAGGSAVKFGVFPRTYYSQDNSDVYIDVDPDALYGDAGTVLNFFAFDIG